jgi:hypothetical protein
VECVCVCEAGGIFLQDEVVGFLKFVIRTVFPFADMHFANRRGRVPHEAWFEEANEVGFEGWGLSWAGRIASGRTASFRQTVG